MTTTRHCPFCAEEIQSSATDCPHCGQSLTVGGQEAGTTGVAEQLPTRPETPGPSKRTSRRWITLLGFLMLAGLGFWFLGFYTIQPIGAVPEGQTWIVRRSEGEPFFNSADGLSLSRTGSVSLMSRTFALALAPRDRIIIRLPYWRFAYLLSTGGAEFGK